MEAPERSSTPSRRTRPPPATARIPRCSPGAYCSVATIPSEWVSSHGSRSQTRRREAAEGINADVLLRDPGGRPAPDIVHAMPRRRPARCALGATPRRDRDRQSLEREKARLAARTAAPIRCDARAPLRRRGAVAVHGATCRRRLGDAGATRTSPAGAPRPLDQPGRERPLTPISTTSWCASDHFSRPAVFDTSRRSDLSSASSASGPRSPSGREARRRAHARSAAPTRTRARIAAHDGRLVCRLSDRSGGHPDRRHEPIHRQRRGSRRRRL